MRGKWRGASALVLAAAAALALACDGSSHPTAPPPAQPPVSAGLGGVWVGERSVAVVTQGQDTCLGRLLAERAPSGVELELPEVPGPGEFWAHLRIDGGGEGCLLRATADGYNLRFFEFKCNVNCWWETFTCDGRLWSFCRNADWIHEFQGRLEGSRLNGLQDYRFHATDGSGGLPDYNVELVFSYDLHR